MKASRNVYKVYIYIILQSTHLDIHQDVLFQKTTKMLYQWK